MDLGTLTLNGRQKFPVAALLRFVGEESFGGERRRGTLRGGACQREERVVKARNSESLRWAVQSPQKFTKENGFGERAAAQRFGEAQSFEGWKWRKWECDGDDAEPSPLYTRGS
jgi:hypothetical protein